MMSQKSGENRPPGFGKTRRSDLSHYNYVFMCLPVMLQCWESPKGTPAGRMGDILAIGMHDNAIYIYTNRM